MRSLLASGARLGLAALCAAGCGERGLDALWDPAASDDSGGENAVVIMGRASDAISLDPGVINDNESVEVCEQIYEHLVRYSTDSAEILPSLATDWRVSDDGKEWIFRLRQGVLFHDGTPFTADAVVFSFERQRNPFHPFHRGGFGYWRDSYQNIEKIEALDPFTVRITIERPYAPFLSTLAMFPVSIVSPTAVKKYGHEFDAHPVGTGPFRLASWQKGDRVVLERNDTYWGEPAKLQELVFRTIPDDRQRLVALEGGAVNVAASISPNELQFVKLHPDLRLQETLGQNVAYVAMNMDKVPFSRHAVRVAVNHAVNKDPIVKLIYQGRGTVAIGPLPPNMWSSRADLVTYPYDPALARALLAKAARAGEIDLKKTLKFYVPETPRPYLPEPVAVARAVQSNLAEVGIKTEIIVQPMGAHIHDVQSGLHDLCLLGWAGDNGDPDNFLYVLLDRDSAVVGDARNVAFYRNGYVHGLLVYAREASEPAERAKYYGKAQEIIAQDAPWVPLAHGKLSLAARAEVEGLRIRPSGIVYFDRVWVRNP